MEDLMQRQVAVVDLGPGHAVVANELPPILLGVALVNTHDRHLGGIDLSRQVLQQGERYAAGRTPCAPKIQEDDLALQRIQIDFFSALRLCGKLGSVILANAAGIVNESLDFTSSG